MYHSNVIICSLFKVNCLLTSKHELRDIRFDVQTGEERHRALTFINFSLQGAQFSVHSLWKTHKNTQSKRNTQTFLHSIGRG